MVDLEGVFEVRLGSECGIRDSIPVYTPRLFRPGIAMDPALSPWDV